MHPHSAIIRLPWSVQQRLDAAAGAFLNPQNGRLIDFARPPGEPALLPPDSVSWRIFKNPIALFIGGIAAVILELAEPAVRTGVWEHSSFRKDPVGRLRRTGLAAMVSVYGARSIAEPTIARIVRMHAKVTGKTPAGAPYCANDPRLLTWVQATAAFGIAEAYSRYADPLSRAEFDALYREGAPASRLYGALDAPLSDGERRILFDSMRGRLEPSPIVFQFLEIMREAAIFPRGLRPMQATLVRAGVDLIPDWIRECLGLAEFHGLRPHERWLVKLAGAASDRIVLAQSPAAQASLRLGLPLTYLYG
jgi:uncharacterized protein (DUF2236 family)